jgi:t-SNARE complex subunit (syntaxin)
MPPLMLYQHPMCHQSSVALVTQVRTIDEQITATAERAKEGVRELVKADRHQRAYRNKCLWLWLVAALVVSVILILMFA